MKKAAALSPSRAPRRSGPAAAPARETEAERAAAARAREAALVAQMFRALDKDRSGTISAAELAQMMQLVGVKHSPQDAAALLAAVDEDGSGEVDAREFSLVMTRRVRREDVPYSAAQVKQAFAVLQKTYQSPPSKARVEDLAHTLAVFGASKGLTKERIDAILLQMEPDAKGLVDTGLYMALMLGDA
jgi:hypothetical protein